MSLDPNAQLTAGSNPAALPPAISACASGEGAAAASLNEAAQQAIGSIDQAQVQADEMFARLGSRFGFKAARPVGTAPLTEVSQQALASMELAQQQVMDVLASLSTAGIDLEAAGAEASAGSGGGVAASLSAAALEALSNVQQARQLAEHIRASLSSAGCDLEAGAASGSSSGGGGRAGSGAASGSSSGEGGRAGASLEEACREAESNMAQAQQQANELLAMVRGLTGRTSPPPQ